MFCEEIKHRPCYTVEKLTAPIPLAVIKKKKWRAERAEKRESRNWRTLYLNNYSRRFGYKNLTNVLSSSHVTCRKSVVVSKPRLFSPVAVTR